MVFSKTCNVLAHECFSNCIFHWYGRVIQLSWLETPGEHVRSVLICSRKRVHSHLNCSCGWNQCLLEISFISIAKVFCNQWNHSYGRIEELFIRTMVTDLGRFTIFEHESHFTFHDCFRNVNLCVWLNCQAPAISLQDDFILPVEVCPSRRQSILQLKT